MSRQTLKRAIHLLPVVVALVGCDMVGVVGDGIVSDNPAVQNQGGPDNGATLEPFITDGQADPGHPSVGELNSGGAGCTATLIGQRTVLTAAHCVPANSATFTLGGQTLHSAQVIAHPSYGGGNSGDVAVVILQQPVQGVSPSPIAVGGPQVGQSIVLVGFGKTGENANDYGTKRMGANTVSQVGPTTFSFQGASNVCNGDSGGPTFVNVGTQQVVYGVHSTKSGFCGSGGTDMRVDAYKDWIRQVANNDVVTADGSSGGGGGGAAPPPSGGTVAQEGEGCWKRQCYQGLTCVAIYNGPAIIAKHCLERCATLGKDPNCDGGETCVKSKDQGRVCFNPSNPNGGYTSNSPGAGNPPPSGNGTTPQGACGDAQESQVFTLLNQVRAQNGRGALKCDPQASKVARGHSQDMCNRGYFSHTSLDGKAPWDRLKAGGVQFNSAGENIAMGYSNPQAVHNGWMNSPGHRQNMLGSSWGRVGIGLVRCGGTPYWTEVFMN